MQWQSDMMPDQGFGDMGGFGMPEMMADENEEVLPNGEDYSQMFTHHDPDNKNDVQRGGKMPHAPYIKPTNVPKFLSKEGMKEAITITIDDDGKENDGSDAIRNKHISFDTLMNEFIAIFNEPRIVEVYFKTFEDGWTVSFMKNNVMIYCDVKYADVIKGLDATEEEATGLISEWKNRYLNKAIEEF